MDRIEAEASEGLAHVLGKYTFSTLSDQEQHAAFMLACTLPDRATISDFINAANEESIIRRGMPASVAHSLAPLIAKLQVVPYAARFASLFEIHD